MFAEVGIEYRVVEAPIGNVKVRFNGQVIEP
jgi:hypothetical protein